MNLNAASPTSPDSPASRVTRLVQLCVATLLCALAACAGLMLSATSNYAYAADDTITITLKGSSIDGGNTAPDFTMTVPRGTTWFDADFDTKDITIPAHFAEEGYVLYDNYPRIMKEPLTSYSSWQDVQAESLNNLETPLNEDTTFYVAVAKYVDTVDLTVQIPTCGEVSTVTDRDETGVRVLGSYPIVSSNNDQVVPYGPQNTFLDDYMLAGSLWLKNETTPLNGMILGERTYLADVGMEPAFGYQFTEEGDHPANLSVTNSNGDAAFIRTSYEGYPCDGFVERHVRFTVTAVHDRESDDEPCKNAEHCENPDPDPDPDPDPLPSTVKLTLKGSSLDGGHSTDDYVMEVPRGSTWADVGVATKEGAILDHFTEAGYTLYGYYPRITTKPLSSYSSWEEVLAESVTHLETALEKDTEYYVAIAKFVDTVELEVKKPLCGEISEVVDVSPSRTEVRGNYPIVTKYNDQVVPFGKEHTISIDTLPLATLPGALWLADEKTPLNATLQGGKTYLAELGVEAAFGYMFDSSQYDGGGIVPALSVLNANGDEVWQKDSYAGGTWDMYFDRLLRFTIDADHDWDEGAITKEPTCTEPGTKTLICKHNGNDWHGEDAIKTEEVPALGHDWGEWVVTKQPTETEEGEETRTCARCGETETRAIEKLKPKPAPGPNPAPDPKPVPGPNQDPIDNDSYDNEKAYPTDRYTSIVSKKDTLPSSSRTTSLANTSDTNTIGLWLLLLVVSSAGVLFAKQRGNKATCETYSYFVAYNNTHGQSDRSYHGRSEQKLKRPF